MNSEKRLTYTRIPNAKWNIMFKNVPQLVDNGSLEIWNHYHYFGKLIVNTPLRREA